MTSVMAREAAPSQTRVLRRLFLMLFLRGRSARRLQGRGTPKSVAWTLRTSLIMYTLFGGVAAFMYDMPPFARSVYLHSMTFLLVGVFIAASAGEVLFNADEADILMHRPVDARALLRAKISVLLQVTLWLAGAFNIGGLIVGTVGAGGNWAFLPVHVLSTTAAALFCVGCIVLVYQLCLRWFGRERLDGLMTTVQVAASVLIVVASQLGPQLMARHGGLLQSAALPWWVQAIPPAWFAGIDDALSGSGGRTSWLLAAIGVGATALVLWLAFAKLAGDFEAGLRRLNERPAGRPPTAARRWLDTAVASPPLAWWLSDPAARASFLLTAAYLVRDRDTKLRVYPAIGPMLIWPFLFLFDSGRHSGYPSFAIAFAGNYLGLIPLIAVNLVRHSQNWQAADLFHMVPITGPGQLCHGARRAVLLVLTAPMLVLFAGVALFVQHDLRLLALLLPGLFALPIYALMPCLGGKAVPCSVPGDATESSRRGLTMLLVMLLSGAWATLAVLGWTYGFFSWLLLVQAVVVAAVAGAMHASVSRAAWPDDAVLG